MNDNAMLNHKPNWPEAKERFNAWWNRSSIDRPMMQITARRDDADLASEPVEKGNPERFHLDPGFRDQYARWLLDNTLFLAEAFPNVNINIGPGSLAVYLGSDPIFEPSTVWYSETIDDLDAPPPLTFDPDNPWLKRHLDITRQLNELSQGEYRNNIPDIIENIDILAALRGPQQLCMDLLDAPEMVKELIKRIDDAYFPTYDAFHELIKDEDGASSYTAFQIWGPGRTAKTQCDFSAMISPNQFREFVQPSLRWQCEILDHSLYHLDGPDAIRHLDAILEVEELDALQWTAGAGQAPSSAPKWDFIHDKVKAAGKCLWIHIGGDSFEELKNTAQRQVDRHGRDGLYLLFPPMTEKEASELLRHAEKNW